MFPGRINLKPGYTPLRFGVDKMEQLLTAVIVAPFVITMVGFAVAIAFAPAVPNEIAPAASHDHDSTDDSERRAGAQGASGRDATDGRTIWASAWRNGASCRQG